MSWNELKGQLRCKDEPSLLGSFRSRKARYGGPQRRQDLSVQILWGEKKSCRNLV
jgi:hypothetical protein